MKRLFARTLTLILPLASALVPWTRADGRGASADKETIVIAWKAAPGTTDPRFTVDRPSRHLENLLHCSLMTQDAGGKLTGELAERWTWSDSRTLTLVLRSGIKFSDGTLLTANDVRATYEFFLSGDGKTASPRAGAFSGVKHIQTPDGKTVSFTLAEPDASFPGNLDVGILPEKLAKGGALAGVKSPIGCGPFVLESFDAHNIRLRKNTSYSLGERPRLEHVDIKIIPEETSILAKLRKGEIDLAQNLQSMDQIANLAKSAPQLQVMRRIGLNTEYIGFNTKDPTLQNVSVRRAISLAIDRNSIIRHLFRGFATPATTLLPPGNPYYEASFQSPSFDPKAAAKLLDEAGFPDPDGTGPRPRFALSYKTTTSATRIQTAKAIASMLKDVGIELKVQALDPETFAGKFPGKSSQDQLEQRDLQLWNLSWEDCKDPDIYRMAFGSGYTGAGGSRRGGYTNPGLDQLLEQGRATLDEGTRRRIYGGVQKLVAEDMPYAFLWHEEVTAVVSRSLKGFELFADGRLTSLRVAWKE